MMIRFTEKITFWQLCNFLKEHKEYKLNKNIRHESFGCGVCENVWLLILSVNQKLKGPTKMLSLDINVEIDKLHIKNAGFESSSSTSISSDSEDSLNPASDLQLSCMLWMSVDSKMQNITVNSDLYG